MRREARGQPAGVTSLLPTGWVPGTELNLSGLTASDFSQGYRLLNVIIQAQLC